MRSRFYYVMNRFCDNDELREDWRALESHITDPSSPAAESVSAEEFKNESVALLPGIADKLSNIETLYYAGATEALGVSLEDLESHLKLLALESYNKIAQSVESDSVSRSNTFFNSVVCGLKLIENIDSPAADELREALEGYHDLISEGYEAENCTEVMQDILGSLRVVLENAYESKMSNAFHSVSAIEEIGLESVIAQATSEVADDAKFETFADVMNELIEEHYTLACEQILDEEGTSYTSFDDAMEAVISRSEIRNTQVTDEFDTMKKEAIEKASEFLSKLTSKKSDVDISQSRNNNADVSKLRTMRIDKIRDRNNINAIIQEIKDLKDQLTKLDSESPADRSKIRSKSRLIVSKYAKALQKVDRGSAKEKQILEKGQEKNVQKAGKETLKEKALRKIAGLTSIGSGKIADHLENKKKRDLLKLEAEYDKGKMSKEQYDAKRELVELKYSPERSRIKSATDRITSASGNSADGIKQRREKIVKDGGKYVRDRKLHEEEIHDAQRRREELDKVIYSDEPIGASTSKSTKSSDSTKTTTKATAKKEELKKPSDFSHIENWRELTAEQRKQFLKTRKTYRDLYDKIKEMEPGDPDFADTQNKAKSALKELKDLAKPSKNGSNNQNPSTTQRNDNATGTAQKSSGKGKGRKGKAVIEERMSVEEKKKYKDLLNQMTMASQALKDYEDECKEKGVKPNEKKLNSHKGMLEKKQKAFNDFKDKFEETATEALANFLYEDVNLLQYALNEGFSIYDLAKIDEEALESFFADISDIVYDDCMVIATEAVKEKETRSEKKVSKEEKQKQRELNLREERKAARDQVIKYAEGKMAAIDKLQKSIGAKWHAYSNDVKNLTERAANDKLSRIRNIRERNIVKQSVGGGKYDFAKYGKLLEELKSTRKELQDFISSKKFFDEYDKTDNPKKDYQKAIKEINDMVKRLLAKAIKSDTKLAKMGQVLDKSSVVQHERDDKEAWRKKQAEDALKRDKKENPDKYRLLDANKAHDKYVKDRAEMEARQANERQTIVAKGTESMDLPDSVDSIDEFGYSVECMLFDLRDNLVEPEDFFESGICSAD